MNKERLIQAGALGFGLWLVSNAFTKASREKIWQRAEGRSELSGDYQHLECAHLDHSRSNPDYNNPDNGLLVTIYEHLNSPEVGHIPQREFYPESPLPNGLTPEWNEAAIRLIEQRLPPQCQELRQMSLSELNDALFG